MPGPEIKKAKISLNVELTNSGYSSEPKIYSKTNSSVATKTSNSTIQASLDKAPFP